MKYQVRNRRRRPLCRVCGRPISLFFSGWRHVGPWKNVDGHRAEPSPPKKPDDRSSR